MKSVCLLMLGMVVIFLSGCATYSLPLTKSPSDIPKTASIAKGTVTTILWIFKFGDASGESIAAKAGFTKIYRLDYKESDLLGGLLFSDYTVIVTGEPSNSLNKHLVKNTVNEINKVNKVEEDSEIEDLPTPDIVYLKNGSIIHGQVVKDDGRSLKIKTGSGNVYTYQVTDVDKITHNQQHDDDSSSTESK
jgi:hypothetical protein